MTRRGFMALAGAAAIVIGALAWIAVSLLGIERRLARLEATLGARSDAGGPSAPAPPPSTATSEPSASAPPIQAESEFAIGYETFRTVWFPRYAAVAEQKCWGVAERAGGRVPRALHYFISVDANGAPVQVTADESSLQGFPMPAGLRECVGGVIRTMRFPPSKPHSGRVQVDRRAP